MGGGGKALATTWYVIPENDSVNTTTQIKCQKDSWPDRNATTSANSLNEFLNSTDASNIPVSGDTVYILACEYQLTARIDLTSKTLHIYGGFESNTISRSSDRSLSSTASKTTLNAKQSSSVFKIETNSTIDGFTITGGYNNSDNGGGLLISGGSSTITNCTISGNKAGKGGGGLYIGASGSPIITNCTITGNKATSNNNNGGGLYIDGGTPTITNCTIVNNTAPNGNEIYRSSGTVNLRNTLVWNTENETSGTDITYSYCAYPSATGDNNITFDTWDNPVLSDVTVNGVTHKVYKISDNYSALQKIQGKGSHDIAPSFDQIGNAFANPPSIGATEYALPVLSVDISGESAISTKYGTAATETFASIASLDNEALASSDYALSWDVTVSDTNISIDQSGNLTVGSTTPIGTYKATVKAQATHPELGIKSNVASKDVTITVESGDIILTLTSKDLPGGTVGTAYTEAQYFTATVEPSSAALTWEVSGLPAGLSFDKGKISGMPTEDGDFTIKVTVTATLANYNAASKDITASITIEKADSGGGDDDDDGGSGGGETLNMTLTLSEKSKLLSGKVDTNYSATLSEYYTLTGAPDGASIAWTTSGTLPGGLTCTDGVISGTPTTAGSFDFNVVATVTASGYNTASKDIAASITIESNAGDDTGGGDDNPEDDGETYTIDNISDINNIPTEQKATITNFVLKDVSNLSALSNVDFSAFTNLTVIKISSDVEVGNGGELDLSDLVLPASVTFSLSGNTSLKSLKLKDSKVANIDASGCSELKSVDVSGNTFIVTLDVSSTNIKLLDASRCSKLTSINCSNCLLSELNVEACNALERINCSNNSLLVLDIPSGLTKLASVDCINQEMINWRSAVSLNFDEFVRSPDVASSSDNTTSASSVAYLPAGMVRVSATKLSNVANLKAYDASNNEIAVTSDDNGNITFASAPDTMTYDYNIGFKNTSMDVTVYAADNELNDTIGSSSSCGCNVMKNEGLNLRNILILLLFELALLKLKITRR
ncbi:MAG: putative Ig domain-containing protein [Synergistaceae bacterium]|nr:putative Ig domain-containing protein [Synergistaceae bacterium]